MECLFCATITILWPGNADVNITFPDFSTMQILDEIICFEVLILDDDILEGEEYVEISISADNVSVDRNLIIVIQDGNDLEGKWSKLYMARNIHKEVLHSCNKWDRQVFCILAN